MTLEDIALLCRDDVRRSVEENLERDPAAVALDRRIEHAALVATQVKYLQRARRKLPAYHEARCIMLPLSFEQASGEDCALHKASRMSGESALDLTCGLGVDAWALSQRFGRVVAVERDEVTAAVARENFRRLGALNIEVVCDSAENYVAACTARFDWCCADPDRRAGGRRRFLPEDCSPDIFALGIIPLPSDRETDAGGRAAGPQCGSAAGQRIAERVVVKNSPLYDVDEAFRAFGGMCSVETVSSGDECKEVLVWFDGGEPQLTATALGQGSFSIPFARRGGMQSAQEPFRHEEYRWVVVPDVSIVKSRLVREHLGGSCTVAGVNGCGFAVQRPCGVLGRVFEIVSMERYEPRRLKQRFKGVRATVMLRDVPLGLDRIMRATGLAEGGDRVLLFTSAGGEVWAVELRRAV